MTRTLPALLFAQRFYSGGAGDTRWRPVDQTCPHELEAGVWELLAKAGWDVTFSGDAHMVK
jgi:hypothetical protein